MTNLSPKKRYTEPLTPPSQPYQLDIAAAENYDSMEGDYAQLEDIVLQDLKMHKKYDKNVSLKNVKKDRILYDKTVKMYWDRLDDFGIPDKDKALWWLMPGRYKKSKGKIENLPEKFQNIMENRVKNIEASRKKRKNGN